MKIAIIGSGAMGCLFGAGLSKEHEVIMVCHLSTQADAINRHGLTIYESDGSQMTYKDNITGVASGKCTEKADLIIVLTKTYSTAEALEANRGILRSDTMVLTLQNGGGNAEVLEGFCNKDNIFIGTTKHNCVNLGHGVIRHSGAGITYIGAYTEKFSASSLVKLFNDAGFEAAQSDNISYLIWEKLFVNLSVNSYTAIARAPIGACTGSSSAWYFMEKLICEAIDVARACGHDFSYYEILEMVHTICSKVSTGFSSMSQDVMNCRQTEIDSINGYVVKCAKQYNIRTPYNELIVNLVHSIESTYQYQEMPVERFAADRIILSEGQSNSNLYEIISGRVCLYYKYGQKNEHLVGIMSAGSCIGVMSCFTGAGQEYTVVTYEDTLLMKISQENLHRYISLNPGNALSIMKKIANGERLCNMDTAMIMNDLNHDA